MEALKGTKNHEIITAKYEDEAGSSEYSESDVAHAAEDILALNMWIVSCIFVFSIATRENTKKKSKENSLDGRAV